MSIIVLKKSLLARNDRAAEENRALFDRWGVTVVNVLGGAGCGKTSILERVIGLLGPDPRVAVIEGDIATTRDAERIARCRVPVVQVLTEGGCHLTASLVYHAVQRLDLSRVDLLLIENVGNPICPANFDLGEHGRIVVLSVTEGDDKPAKYPLLFRAADLVLISKCDLIDRTDFDVNRAARLILAGGPTRAIMQTSIHRSETMSAVAEWLKERCASRTPTVSGPDPGDIGIPAGRLQPAFHETDTPL